MTGRISLSFEVDDADPLEMAGRRLDAAAAELDRLCAPAQELPEESKFGLAEAAFAAARASFRNLLAERLGVEANAVARRLSL